MQRHSTIDYCSMIPCWSAIVTASVRLPAPSLPKIELTWNLTVRSLMTSWAAISLFCKPRAINCKTSCSRGESASTGLAVLALADVAQQLGHDNRLQERPARVDDANRLEQFFARRALEQIALRARLHRAENPLVGVERREDDHADADASRARSVLSASTPSISGISRSSSSTSGRSCSACATTSTTIGRRADDLEIGLRAEDGDQAIEHDRMIVGDQNTNAS